MDFEDFNDITASRPYIYRSHPLHDHSYVILKQREDDGRYVPVGDYTVLDLDEKPALSEKKLMNLVSLMNGEDRLIDLRGETKSRLLFYRAPTDEPDKTRIIFYTLGPRGVSTENAVLSLEEGIEDEA